MWGRAAVFLVSGAVTCAFFIQLCDAVFRCGCRPWWAGAADHCNIHTPGAKHCPWCSFGAPGAGLILGLILGPQAWVSFRLRRRWRVRLGIAILVFPLAGALLALASGWLTGYWVQ